MIEQIHYYLSYDFVRNALIAGSLAGILGAVVGYFVVIRKVSFAAHSLAHIGFTGATGAVLFALSPLEGMLIISVLAGMMMGATGNRLQRSDMAIGMTLSLCLGVGTLFLTLYKGFAGQATAILFGNIFGVSHHQIVQTLVLSVDQPGNFAVCFAETSFCQRSTRSGRGARRFVVRLVHRFHGDSGSLRHSCQPGGRHPAGFHTDHRPGGHCDQALPEFLGRTGDLRRHRICLPFGLEFCSPVSQAGLPLFGLRRLFLASTWLPRQSAALFSGYHANRHITPAAIVFRLRTNSFRHSRVNASNNWNWGRLERFTLSQASGFAGGR
jgi:hypothetical protein